MSDIRINALTTTAASSASDDYLPIDGSANGTRKLNAYSPTFGGNLTVSGDASIGTNVFKIDSTNTRILLGLAAALQGDTLEIVSKANAGAISLFGRASDNGSSITFRANGAATQKAFIQGGDLGIQLGGGSSIGLTIDSSKNATLAGNLTVSGTGTSSVAGSLGIGTTSPGTLLDAVGTSSTGLVRVTDYSNGDAGQFIARGSRGTPASPTAQSASDSTGLLRMYGYDGSSFIENARIYAQTAGTIATNRVGGILSFWTHPDSTSAIAEAMRITQAQNLLIGPTTDTGQKLQVKGGTRITDSASASNYITIGSGNDAPYGGNSVVAQTGTLVMGTVASASLLLYTNATTALTLDSSQNATFAGDVVLGAGKRVAYSASAYITPENNVDGAEIASPGQFTVKTASTQALKIDSSQNATFAGNIKTAAPSGGTAATWRLGTVASVSPTSPNRTIEVEIGGTTYYIHAKTTNN